MTPGMKDESGADRVLLGPGRTIAVALGCLAASLFFFSPRLWLMRSYVAGSFQWTRAQTFLLQCAHPFRTDIEAAMRWRLLPPVACRLLRLPGNSALVVPWVGVVALTIYATVILRRRRSGLSFVAGGTLLFAASSAVLVPTGWLGMNDGWAWFGLLAVSFGRSRLAIPLACLLCPWVDERFLLALPLAWIVRCQDRSEPVISRSLVQLSWLAPYAAVRMGFDLGLLAHRGRQSFFHGEAWELVHRIPYVPIAWWMALRAAWVPVCAALWLAPTPARRTALGLALAATLLAGPLVASDMSRSAAMVVPVLLLGCLELDRRSPGRAPQTLLLLGAANLLIPAAHVVLDKVDWISPLPVEVLRLFRAAP
jgi:hypothetical protein